MNSVHVSRAGLRALGIAAMLGLAAAGCGGDDDEGGRGGGDGQSAKPSRLAIELSGSGKKPTFSVPKSVGGGTVEISFTNSAKGSHSAQLIGAKPGHTPQEALAAGNAWGETGEPLPDWVILAGGLGDVEPGQTSSVTQKLAPGTYVVADLNSGANAEFEVKGSPGRGELAADGGTIDATEYEFTSDGLKPGQSRVLFDNAGGEPHFIAAVKLKRRATIEQARRFFETEKGPPPFDESQTFNTAVLEGGDSQTFEADLKAGKYALLCFVPDRAGGPPHVVKGMISEAVVGG